MSFQEFAVGGDSCTLAYREAGALDGRVEELEGRKGVCITGCRFGSGVRGLVPSNVFVARDPLDCEGDGWVFLFDFLGFLVDGLEEVAAWDGAGVVGGPDGSLRVDSKNC